MTVSAQTVAPLANVGLCSNALARARDRAQHLPGWVVFYGPSGFGKSFSAAYTANKNRAYYLECKSSWTRKALLLAMLKEMGIAPAKTLYDLTDQVAEQLVLSGRPLIIDEVDHIVDKGAVEILRDVYQGSAAAMLLIGEEQLPAKLKQWERAHGRVLEWIPARPASLDDARHLAKLYCRGVDVADDLLSRIHHLAKGSVRRICVNLDRVEAEARSLGASSIDLRAWGTRELYTGEAPRRG